MRSPHRGFSESWHSPLHSGLKRQSQISMIIDYSFISSPMEKQLHQGDILCSGRPKRFWSCRLSDKQYKCAKRSSELQHGACRPFYCWKSCGRSDTWMCHLELSQPWHPLRHWGLKRQNQKKSMTTIFLFISSSTVKQLHQGDIWCNGRPKRSWFCRLCCRLCMCA